MVMRFDADGDTWEVGYERHPARPDLDAVVFHCVSDTQRPYRVIPLPPDLRRDGGEAGEDPPRARLRRLFDRSQTMDFVHDPQADPRNRDMHTEP
jgi:hypothetical protein